MKKNLSVVMLLIAMVFGFQFCSEPSGNKEELRTKITVANDEIFNKQNYDYADRIFTDDFAGEGPQFIKNFASDITTAFPDLESKIEQIAVEGNQAGWFRTNTGTHTNEYLGYPASGEKISWTEILFTQFNDEGMIMNDWYATDLEDKLQETNSIDGVYQYLPPLKGTGILKNGNFMFLVGPADDSNSMTGQSGTFVISNGILQMTIVHSTDPSQIGWEFWSRTKSWDGDTITYETMNTDGELTGEGRALRIAK